MRIQVVSDGRAGIENQALGLAEAIGCLTLAEISVKRIRWRPMFDRLPSGLKTLAMLDPGADDPFPSPTDPSSADPSSADFWPDLWIATGRASLPLSLMARKRSGGRTFVVQTQDPRLSPSRFDMVVAPAHDGLSGDNVFEITGSPHRVTPEQLARSATRFSARLTALPHPRLAVLIGGRSAAFDLTPEHALGLADQIARLIHNSGGSLMLTFSRRTPPAARAVMMERLSAVPGEIWDETGENPLFAYLHHADHVLVTEDSANMATEAAATGKPVHILPMVALKPPGKFARLHAELQDLGITRPFLQTPDKGLETWTYDPLNETERAARAILEAMASCQT